MYVRTYMYVHTYIDTYIDTYIYIHAYRYYRQKQVWPHPQKFASCPQHSHTYIHTYTRWNATAPSTWLSCGNINSWLINWDNLTSRM